MTLQKSLVHTNWPYPKHRYTDVREVLEQLKPVDPLYLFCENSLIRRAQFFQQSFPGNVSYAVKANPDKRVLKTLLTQGIVDFDVASINEIESLHHLAPNARLHFNNPVKAQHAISKAYFDYGVRFFALDDPLELDKIIDATAGARDLVLSVRFKLAHRKASFDFGRKFGASPANAVLLLKAIKRLGIKTALTFHPGSQCTSADTYGHYIKTSSQIVEKAGVNIEHLNVGGGFPEQYLNQNVPALQDYFSEINTAIARHFPNEAPRLICEPGRSMVAGAASLLTQVIHIRPDRSAVYLNDGIYGGLQEQSIVDHLLPLKFWRGNQPILSPQHKVILFGPTCDPTDKLPGKISVPDALRAGDHIEFGLAGAYGSATATRFNGFESNQYVNVRRCFYDL